MVDEIRAACEEAGGAHTWLHDDLGATEAFEWEGPQGELQITLDPVFGSQFLLHQCEDGELVIGELNDHEHLLKLVAWLETGGEVPES